MDILKQKPLQMSTHTMPDPSTFRGKSWSVLRRDATEIASIDGVFELATTWYGQDTWEVRYVAVSVLGRLAGQDEPALAFLFEQCGQDPAWQVHEALAMAIDDYCAVVGYQEALPVLDRWLTSPHPSVRRAVSEGLRPWTASKRGWFAAHPERVIELLGRLRDDASRSVQESVGNALRDIARKHPELVLDAIRTWLAERPDSTARRTIARHALKHAVKVDPSLASLYQ